MGRTLGPRAVRPRARAYRDCAARRLRSAGLGRDGTTRMVRRILEHPAAGVRAPDVPHLGDRSGLGVEPAGAEGGSNGCAPAQADAAGRGPGRAHRVCDRSDSVGARGGGRGVRGTRDRAHLCTRGATHGHPRAGCGGLCGARGLAWRPQRIGSSQGRRISAIHPGRDSIHLRQRNALLAAQSRR